MKSNIHRKLFRCDYFAWLFYRSRASERQRRLFRMEEQKIMSYEDNRNCVGAPEAGMLQGSAAPLSRMMDQANNIAQEILIMAQKINVHMFGVSITDRDEAEPPTCFRDVLANQLKTLNEAACELTAIMDKLGV